ncbi:MAG TPA: ATP-grasp domain-containing protein [Chitinophagaceae bacterium]|nr:ATP-grasp domain-containing protein [Chitinophagaceae bacterium]
MNDYVVCFQPGYNGREVIKAAQACRTLNLEWRVKHPKDFTENCIPIGDVEYCEAALLGLGISKPVPDFYPEFLCHLMFRHFYIIDLNRKGFSELKDKPISTDVFIKDSTSYKHNVSRIYKVGEKRPNGINYYVDPVSFTQEWRYYVSNGKVLTTGWYDGDDEEEPAPELDIAWPEDFCGAVDFGRLDTGVIALVESHDPYACGHYSDDHEAYLQWTIEGFEYVKKKFYAIPLGSYLLPKGEDPFIKI